MGKRHFFKLAYMGMFIFFAACNADKKELLVNTWHMHHDEMILDLRADGSYVVNEYEKKNIGKWRLSPDAKTIIFNQKDDSVEKELTIETLEDNKLVLDDNGLDMIFTSTPETIESE